MKFTLDTKFPEREEPINRKAKRFPINIEIQDDAVYIKTTKRELWIEVNEHGDLIAHAYNTCTEEPVNVRIREERVDVDTDRDGAFRLKSYGCHACEVQAVFSGVKPKNCPYCESVNIEHSEI